MPLQRRVPKFGFKNINRKEYRAINIDTVQDLLTDKKIAKELTIELLVELRLAHSNDLVKILGRGKLDSPIKVTAHKFSASAKAAIEAAGGEAVTV
jgi:large subunit ribosomal protein L15